MGRLILDACASSVLRKPWTAPSIPGQPRTPRATQMAGDDPEQPGSWEEIQSEVCP